MRVRCLFLFLGVGLAFLTALPSRSAEKNEDGHIARLIGQLGSGSYAEREEASKALDQIGPPALAALKEATRSPDEEVSRRAEDLVAKVCKRLEMEKLLAPTRVHLIYGNTPVEVALEDFAKKTGYPIVIEEEDKTKVAGRKVTLDTGETTFWEAFDLFCQKAGLDVGSKAQPPGPPGRHLPLDRSAPIKGAFLPQADGIGMAFAADPTLSVRSGIGPGLAGNATPITLIDRNPQVLPTCYTGALRLRALPVNTPGLGQVKGEGEIFIPLELSPEPKIQWKTLMSVRVEKAVDDGGQSLAQVPENGSMSPGLVPIAPAANVRRAGFIRRQVGTSEGAQPAVRLKAGDKPSRSLKELKGTLAAQVQTNPETLITVYDILHASNKSISNDAGSLKVFEVTREENGNVKIHLQLDLPPPAIPSVTAGGVAWPGVSLSLLDSRGNSFPLVASKVIGRLAGRVFTREFQMTYQASKSQGEPAQLIFTGSRLVTLEIPFTLKDVPLS